MGFQRLRYTCYSWYRDIADELRQSMHGHRTGTNPVRCASFWGAQVPSSVHCAAAQFAAASCLSRATLAVLCRVCKAKAEVSKVAGLPATSLRLLPSSCQEKYGKTQCAQMTGARERSTPDRSHACSSIFCRAAADNKDAGSLALQSLLRGIRTAIASHSFSGVARGSNVSSAMRLLPEVLDVAVCSVCSCA